ncbi:tetratricopeptide (TPR) repeat protein [Anaerosolibacter carboniphilus]|uniref:Tetratricopeptide (TPR) repeat protein n=1 Tax=Anaerosolibacter carboniphilus TaxID=1417629 RepID=A0A841KUY6_9FIRM|nr:helix-turn-helix transcriptional regulator [Anaerosolibacter carboniphilus]MBB6217207.1 tetratricopeptide (TPR) repeat protein [Anaerosolibacter carboniphilus]
MYFLEDTILPPGEKLKRLRVYLDATQQDAADGKISRNLISYIEQGKTKLTKDTAEVIVENLTRLARERKISVDFTAEYLMRSELEQAEHLLGKYVEHLQEMFHADIEKFEVELNKAKEILQIWDITEKKAQIYEISGDYYARGYHYNESYIHYLISLENYIRIHDNLNVVKLYSKLGKSAYDSRNYKEVINLHNHALLIMKTCNIEDGAIMKKVLFNNALAHIELGSVEQSLQCLEELERRFPDLSVEQKADVLILKGNCYFKQGAYEAAQKEYEKALDIIDIRNADQGGRVLALENLGRVYHKYGQTEKAIDYMNEGIAVALKTNSVYCCDVYMDLGDIYASICNYDLAENAYLKALYKAKDTQERGWEAKNYERLLTIYINQDKGIYIEQLLREISIACEANPGVLNDDELRRIYLKAASYYMDRDTNKAKELLDLVLANLK